MDGLWAHEPESLVLAVQARKGGGGGGKSGNLPECFFRTESGLPACSTEQAPDCLSLMDDRPRVNVPQRLR